MGFLLILLLAVIAFVYSDVSVFNVNRERMNRVYFSVRRPRWGSQRSPEWVGSSSLEGGDWI